MIILFGNEKGGVGKSTMACNTAAQLANLGHDVVLVDADRQSTSSNWANDRAEDSNLSTVHCIQKYDNIRDTLLDMDNRYAFVIVDAAGRDSRELRTGMAAAHVLIIPFKPSQPDLDTLYLMQTLITEVQDLLNPTLKVHGLLTMSPTNPIIRKADAAKEFLKAFPDIKLLTTIIHDRKVYQDAICEGKGVLEMDNPKAKLEMTNLLKEIL